MDIERPDITGKCPTDYKMCGNSVSAPSDLTCVPKEGSLQITSDADIKEQLSTDSAFDSMCPITEVKIGKSNKPAKSKEHSLNEGYKLWTSDQAPSMLPVVEASISQGTPCLSPTENAVTKGRYTYPLTKLNYTTHTQQGCKSNILDEYFTDSRYDKIDQVDEKTLFMDNRIYNDLNSLPMS